MTTRLTQFASTLSLLLVAQLSVAGDYLNKTRMAPDTTTGGTVKIVGGGPSTEGQQRWITSLQYEGEHFCGGAVVGSEWILTAAHCTVGETAGDPGLSVWVGGHDLFLTDQGFRRDVVQIIVHSQYNDSTLENDIALLRLASSLPDSIPTVLLPTMAVMSGAGAPNQPATVSGWGALSENGGSPDQMHQVTLPIVTNSECNSPSAYDGEINSAQICAGLAEGGKDSCYGDSGGPLWVTSGSSEYHIGVVSWGEGCAQPNKYGVYTRTYSHRDWILDRIGSNGGPTDPTDPTDPTNPTDPTDPTDPGDSCPNPAPPDPLPPVAENALDTGETIAGLSGAEGTVRQYYIDVPSGQSRLVIKTWSGSGDVDLYVARGREASPDDHDYAPYLFGNTEKVRVNNPPAGRWHITLHGYEAFNNVMLRATITP